MSLSLSPPPPPSLSPHSPLLPSPSIGYASVSLDVVVDCTKSAVEENRLFRCLLCRSLSLIPPDWLKKGGDLYEKAAQMFKLEDGLGFSFPYDGVSAKYDGGSDSLIVIEVSLSVLRCALQLLSLRIDIFFSLNIPSFPSAHSCTLFSKSLCLFQQSLLIDVLIVNILDPIDSPCSLIRCKK